MMHKSKKHAGRIFTTVFITLCLAAILLLQSTVQTSGNERYFSGAAKEYYQELLEQGFPEDYAISLTELHLLHPTWKFVPLDVTGAAPTYTWDYVIEQETKNPSTNLISGSDTYAAYRHPTNTTKYDSGYYQASAEAVAYFMDPRNFLNEADLFLFFDLAAQTTAPEAAVAAVLEGTFMEGATLENGQTYAAYFCELGTQLGINPVYLAAKVRQEQGVGGTSPTISGLCGDKLLSFYTEQTQQTASGSQVLPPAPGTVNESELTALNGYYNFFNVKASGTGLFAIYRNAMERAVTGTEDMKPEWGGSPAWNTKWKSLFGGAYLLKNNYVDRYQSTVYLQKFNVDSRSDRNFWGQYMQAVSGGLTEARSLYQSFASIDALDHAYTFLIPVYEGMPSDPSPDPAGGTCTLLAQAPTRYSYQSELTSPTRASAASGAVYTAKSVYPNEQFSVTGVMTHTYGIRELQYAWDGGDWQTVSDGNQLNFTTNADFFEGSSHILVVRGKAAYDHDNASRKHNAYFLCAVIYVSVTPPPQVTLRYEVGNTSSERIVPAGATVTLPESDAPEFAGWLGNDNTFLPSGATFVIQNDVTYRAIFLDFRVLSGAAVSTEKDSPDLRFSAVLDKKSRTALGDYLSLSATLTKDGIALAEQPIQQTTDTGNWVRLDAVTPALTEAEYDAEYSASFCVKLQYSDNTEKRISAVGTEEVRTAKQVAAAALQDRNVTYSDAAIALWKSIAE